MCFFRSTTKQIEPKLPAESLKVWKERGIVDYIVILDWYCSTDDLQPGSNARCLKDAIYKVSANYLPTFLIFVSLIVKSIIIMQKGDV